MYTIPSCLQQDSAVHAETAGGKDVFVSSWINVSVSSELMCVFFSCFGTNTCPDKDMQPVYSVEWRLFVSLHCLLMFVIYSIVQKALWMLYSYPSCSVMKIYPAMSTGAMFRLKNTGLLVIQMVCQTPRWPQSQCFKKMNLPARVPRAIFGFWANFFTANCMKVI